MLERVLHILEQKFNVFVHKTIKYKRIKKHVVKESVPTISGLVFVQGDISEIQSVLDERCLGVYLVKDRATGLPAQIRDKSMQAFIRMSQISPFRIRIMPHPIGYYSAGHPMVKITSGILNGVEGYQVRISRDKCLITTMGGLTIALGGVSKESFENIEEYASIDPERYRELRQCSELINPVPFSEISVNISQASTPHSIKTASNDLDRWVQKAEFYIADSAYEKAFHILKELLHEMGATLRKIVKNDLSEIYAVCIRASKMLKAMTIDMEIEAGLRNGIKEEMKILAERYPAFF